MNATEPAPTAVAASTERPNLIKRLYNWVLHWADTRYGVPALFVLAFLESSFFAISRTSGGIALCMGAPKKSFKFAGWCAVGSVLGGIGGYYIGYLAEPLGRWIIFDLLHYGSAWDKVAELYGHNAFLAIVAAAFTPIPYKVFTIAAGVFHEQVPLLTLIAASVLGRTSRFVLVGGTIFFFGPPVKRLLDKYLEWAALGLFGLGVLGFVAIKYLF
jgi:membrane protein YqaA with SNARE-associated domain